MKVCDKKILIKSYAIPIDFRTGCDWGLVVGSAHSRTVLCSGSINRLRTLI